MLALLMLAGLVTGRAQQDPPGCQGSGLGIALFVDKPQAHVGDTLNYSVLVYNNPFPSCKASSISAWVVTPDGVTNSITLRRTTLNPGESDNYQNVAKYVIRAEDIKDGVVKAGAADTAKIHQNVTLSDGAAAQTVNTMIVNPCIEVTESCTDAVGETGALQYSGTVRNCGDVPLVNVTVTNILEGVGIRVYGPATLAVGQSATFTSSYRPKNICGPVTATYVATGTDQAPAPKTVQASGDTTCGLSLTPGIAIGHGCPPAPVAGGAQFNYTGSVTNTGNVTLTNVVVVSDQPAPGTTLLTVASLAPGAVANFSGRFTAPVNACSVTTSLRVTANSRCGQPVSADSVRNCPLLTHPAIVVTENCPTTPVAPGEKLTYTGTVKNTGDVTLRNVQVVSAQPTAGTVVLTLDQLDPGAVANFTGSYTTPLDTCSVANTVTATGTGACDSAAVSNSVTATCPLTTSPAITISRTCPDTAPPLGGTLTYTATVQNTGNVTLQNVVVVSGRPSANTVVARIPSLAPGEANTFTGSFPVPANTPGCSITDTLTANGADKCQNRTVSNSVTTTCPVAASPKVKITANCPTAAVGPGSSLTYSGTVSNPGDVALTNVVVTADLPAPGTVVTTIATLAPGANANFTGSYTTPLDACDSTVNLAVTAKDVCGGTPVSDSFVRTCPLVSTPAIAVTKSCPVDLAIPGKPLVFGGTVTNTGNITLTNVVVVNDLPAPGAPVFGPVTLAPGAGAAFTGSFLVPTNLNACSITSTVKATGNSKCDGKQVTASATGACPVKVNPNLLLTTACPPDATPQGARLTFSGTLKNTGNITLTNLVVVNDHPTNGTPVFKLASLAPGQSTNFTGSYIAPSNCCEVVSTLLATGTDACGQTNVSDTATMVCPVKFTPAVTITKVCSDQPVRQGEELVYTGTISNAGNITLVGVKVFSAYKGEASPSLGPVDLSPGERLPYTVHFTVPSDFCGWDRVTVVGQSMCGQIQTSNSVDSLCPVLTMPGIAVQNMPLGGPVPRCAIVTGHASIANVGNVTLTNVMVYCNQPTNGAPAYGPITLGPWQVKNFDYTFTTPTYCDCCQVPVTLSASGLSRCDGAKVSSSSTVVLPLETNPHLIVTLNCPSRDDVLLGLGFYDGVVSNTGDITLSNVVVVSTLPTAGTVLVGPINLAPGESQPYMGDVASGLPDDLLNLEVTASGRDVCSGVEVSSSGSCYAVGTLTLTVDSTGAVLRWPTTIGAKYVVQFRDNLLSGEWQSLGDPITANGDLATKLDPAPLKTARFYRVMQVE